MIETLCGVGTCRKKLCKKHNWSERLVDLENERNSIKSEMIEFITKGDENRKIKVWSDRNIEKLKGLSLYEIEYIAGFNIYEEEYIAGFNKKNKKC